MSKPEKQAPKQEPRPIIPTGVMTEFGEVYEDPNVREFGNGDQIDVTYTPGWSELRVKYDTEKGEASHGKRPPHKVAPLPGNVRLVRRTTVSGSPDFSKTIQHTNKGYKPITQADVGQPWFRELPAGVSILPDGSIAKGDCVYMYCPPEQAARNAAAKAKRTMERIGAPEARAEEFGMATDRTKGEDVQLGSQISPTAVPRG